MNKTVAASRLYLLIVFLLSVFVVSCKTERKVIMEPIREQGPDYLFQQLKKNELQYNTLSVKFSAEAEVDNKNQSFSGNLYIIRDSLIWVSIQKFGLEAARLLLTNDTAKMMNRLNNTYFIGDFDYVNELFNTDFDFDMIQALVTGNDFRYYESTQFRATVENKNYKLSTVNRIKLKKFVKHENEAQKVLIQDIWLDPKTFKIEHILLKEVKNQNRKFESFYSDFADLEGQLFPNTIMCEITEEKKISVNISFDKITLNKNETASFRIPQSYQRVEMKK
jgi:hypothetical protein